MTEPDVTEKPMPPVASPTVLDALRSEGAEHFDPVRFRYLEALLQRMLTAPEAVQRVLQDKLQTALAVYTQRFKLAQEAARAEVSHLSATHPSLARELRALLATGDLQGLHRLRLQAAAQGLCVPLKALNEHIQSVTQHSTDAPEGSWQSKPEMKSVRRFREAFSKMAAEVQVDKAMARKPENAGPLNSHMLVLRSLALMRECSPDYLRRFMSHADTLLWLEQENQPHKPVKPAKPGKAAEAKPARKPRVKKQAPG